MSWIFCFLKDIEPFENQVLLQPGLSFDSRDTTIISLQEDPEIDNSANTGSVNTESRGNEITIQGEKISTSRRLPSAVEERGEPSYSVFDDTSSNIDYLSTDFDSREEIELLNEKLEELKFKSGLFLSEGAKRKCTIPEGIYNSYIIKKQGADGFTNETFEEGEKYDYDYFSGLEIECVGGDEEEATKEITCEGTNEYFKFSGCKRQCEIPQGYTINGDERTVQLYDHDSSDLTPICDRNNGYIQESTSGTPSIGECPENLYEFQSTGCVRQCNFVQSILTGYNIDSNVDVQSISSELSENYFTGIGISCDEPNYIQQGDPQISCNSDGDFETSGCEKRQCSIPEGYKIRDNNNGRDYKSGTELFDFDMFTNPGSFTLGCDDNYEGPASMGSGDDICTEDNVFNLDGCVRQCSIPSGGVPIIEDGGFPGISGDYYIIPRGRQLHTPLSEEFTSTMLRDYISRYWTILRSQDMYNQNTTLEYDHFDSLNIGCTKPGDALGGEFGPNMVPGTAEITCPIGDSGETPIFVFSCN